MKLIKLCFCFLSLISCLLLLACKPACPPEDCEGKARPLADLQQLSMKTNRAAISALRGQALRETALSVGARGGLAYRAYQINCILLAQEKLLYRVYNFNQLMLDKSVLPPVLIEGRKLLNLASNDAIRIADRSFQILHQAKFVTVPPTWREYLWMSYPPPDEPDRSLLPRNAAERIIWKKYIDEGWQCGIDQANTIFRENIGRLKRDFEGMIRYRTLLAQNMVSPPFVAELDLGVTGNCNDMNVNDRVLRITALPCLQVDSKNWKTEILPYE